MTTPYTLVGNYHIRAYNNIGVYGQVTPSMTCRSLYE